MADWSPPVSAELAAATVTSAQRSNGSKATSDSSSSSDSDLPPRDQLQRYPPVQTDAFPRLLEEHIAAVLRPKGVSASVQSFLFTTLLPGVLAVLVTWILFA